MTKKQIRLVRTTQMEQQKHFSNRREGRIILIDNQDYSKNRKCNGELFFCPVCGFLGLHEEPYNREGYGSYEICVCCGFQFGYDDYPDKEKGILNWREAWIRNGCKWFSRTTCPPEEWDASGQMREFFNKEV